MSNWLYNDMIDTEVVALVRQLLESVSSNPSVNPPTKLQSSTIAPGSTNHSTIRKIASNHYIAATNKRVKSYEDSSNLMAHGFDFYDCVTVEIHVVDRTNTDPKYLLYMFWIIHSKLDTGLI